MSLVKGAHARGCVLYYAHLPMFSLTSLTLGILLTLIIGASGIISKTLPIRSQVKGASVAVIPNQNIPPTPTLIPVTPKPTYSPPTPTRILLPSAIPTSKPAPKPTSAPAPVFQGMRGETLSLINNERQSKGLSPLQSNSQLENSASKKAQDLLAKNYWSHTSPDGLEFWNFFESSGYNYLAAGENLAKGYFDAQSLTSGWMQSEGHRNNILNPSYREIGISIVDGLFEGYQTKLVVAHFAQPS